MTFYSNALFLVGGLVMAGLLGTGGSGGGVEHKSLAFLLRSWSVPALGDLLAMAVCGIIASAALPLLAQAYRVAPANLIAPFEYTAIIWGVLYGWLIWSQLPGSWAWIGIGLIAGAGLFVLSRDNKGSPSGWI
jgi:drug/metabolite transporter (DMT)-like permease